MLFLKYGSLLRPVYLYGYIGIVVPGKKRSNGSDAGQLPANGIGHGQHYAGIMIILGRELKVGHNTKNAIAAGFKFIKTEVIAYQEVNYQGGADANCES
jgi:hypothetical protein